MGNSSIVRSADTSLRQRPDRDTAGKEKEKIMATEFKGRFATYYHEGKTTRLSLNAIKTNFGVDIARAVLTKKKYSWGTDYKVFFLELLPGEKTAAETAIENGLIKIVEGGKYA